MKHFFRPPVEREVSEELEFHLEMRTRELVAKGMAPTAARAEAERRLGDRGALRGRLERAGRSRNRAVQLREWWDGVMLDFRLAWRGIRRAPATGIVIVGSLALGIGGATIGFSVVQGVLLRALPYEEPARLVAVEEAVRDGLDEPWELSYPGLRDLQAGARTLVGLGAWVGSTLNLAEGEETIPLEAAVVTPNLFQVLRVAPAQGRGFVPDDTAAGAPAVAIVSHRFWRTHLGGDPAAIGRSLVLSGRPMVPVGVMPEGFWYPDADTDVWLPIGAPQPFMMNRAVHILRGVARLMEGASAEEATRELDGILERIQREEPGSDPGHAIRVSPLHDRVVGNARAAILLLFGAVTAVTLLVCANIGSVLLARSVARRSEVAVRAALGAGGARLARPFLAESLLMGVAGGAAGLAIAVAGVPWLVARLPQGLPRTGEIRLDLGSVLFVVGASVLASLIFGLAPMVGSRGMAAADLLRGAPARSGGGRRDRRIRALVVAGHLAFAQVLLVTGGLFVLSFARLQAVNPGFDASRLISMTVSLTSRYDRDAGIRYYESLPERLTALPGGAIESATAVSALPISGGDGVGELAIEGRPFAPGTAPSASFRRVLPNYFQVMRIPVVAGRAFEPTDRGEGGGEMVVIISAVMADRYWPDGNAIGQRIKIGPPEGEPWLRIVGVAADVHNVGLDAAPGYATYEPLAQRPRGTMRVVVRGRGEPRALAATVRRALRSEDPGLPVTRIETMEERIAESLAARRFNATVMGLLAALAAIIAAIGVFGLTSRAVVEQRRELGVRAALGATPGALVRLVLGRSAVVAGLGWAVGAVASFTVAGALEQFLFGTGRHDLVAFGAATVLLAAVALGAAVPPARTGAKADPVGVLREE